MYNNFEEAKEAALKVINRSLNGEKNGCVVCERKLTKNARKTWWGFRFHDEDTNGEFVRLEDGTYSRMYKI